MSKPDNQVNELHLREPQPGDFWHERFCPYHIVLAVTPDGVVITDKTKPDGSSHYTFDLEAAKEITHEEHARAVRYSSGNGFAADVVPARAAGSVREWKAAGSKYIPIAEQQAAPHAGEALMDTNKMRDVAREQFEKWAKDRYSWHLHDDARGPEERTLASWNGETYGNRIVEGMWQSWQASREAVVVELPEVQSDMIDQVGGEQEVRYYPQMALITAIEAQGLKVAP